MIRYYYVCYAKIIVMLYVIFIVMLSCRMLNHWTITLNVELLSLLCWMLNYYSWHAKSHCHCYVELGTISCDAQEKWCVVCNFIVMFRWLNYATLNRLPHWKLLDFAHYRIMPRYMHTLINHFNQHSLYFVCNQRYIIYSF